MVPDDNAQAARSPRGKPAGEKPWSDAGRLGEERATRFLERSGYRIRERNWSCPAGEIDLIAEHGEYLVFVEVKTRSARDAYPPELAMTKRKQRRVRQLALRYIERTFDGQVPPLQPRFDVVLVILGREPKVEHLTNAF
ncbi:MAG: YraN family protein [SAR324 cluster bacterium]